MKKDDQDRANHPAHPEIILDILIQTTRLPKVANNLAVFRSDDGEWEFMEFPIRHSSTRSSATDAPHFKRPTCHDPT